MTAPAGCLDQLRFADGIVVYWLNDAASELLWQCANDDPTFLMGDLDRSTVAAVAIPEGAEDSDAAMRLLRSWSEVESGDVVVVLPPNPDRSLRIPSPEYVRRVHRRSRRSIFVRVEQTSRLRDLPGAWVGAGGQQVDDPRDAVGRVLLTDQRAAEWQVRRRGAELAALPSLDDRLARFRAVTRDIRGTFNVERPTRPHGLRDVTEPAWASFAWASILILRGTPPPAGGAADRPMATLSTMDVLVDAVTGVPADPVGWLRSEAGSGLLMFSDVEDGGTYQGMIYQRSDGELEWFDPVTGAIRTVTDDNLTALLAERGTGTVQVGSDGRIASHGFSAFTEPVRSESSRADRRVSPAELSAQMDTTGIAEAGLKFIRDALNELADWDGTGDCPVRILTALLKVDVVPGGAVDDRYIVHRAVAAWLGGRFSGVVNPLAMLLAITVGTITPVIGRPSDRLAHIMFVARLVDVDGVARFVLVEPQNAKPGEDEDRDARFLYFSIPADRAAAARAWMPRQVLAAVEVPVDDERRMLAIDLLGRMVVVGASVPARSAALAELNPALSTIPHMDGDYQGEYREWGYSSIGEEESRPDTDDDQYEEQGYQYPYEAMDADPGSNPWEQADDWGNTETVAGPSDATSGYPTAYGASGFVNPADLVGSGPSIDQTLWGVPPEHVSLDAVADLAQVNWARVNNDHVRAYERAQNYRPGSLERVTNRSRQTIGLRLSTYGRWLRNPAEDPSREVVYEWARHNNLQGRSGLSMQKLRHNRDMVAFANTHGIDPHKYILPKGSGDPRIASDRQSKKGNLAEGYIQAEAAFDAALGSMWDATRRGEWASFPDLNLQIIAGWGTRNGDERAPSRYRIDEAPTFLREKNIPLAAYYIEYGDHRYITEISLSEKGRQGPFAFGWEYSRSEFGAFSDQTADDGLVLWPGSSVDDVGVAGGPFRDADGVFGFYAVGPRNNADEARRVRAAVRRYGRYARAKGWYLFFGHATGGSGVRIGPKLYRPWEFEEWLSKHGGWRGQKLALVSCGSGFGGFTRSVAVLLERAAVASGGIAGVGEDGLVVSGLRPDGVGNGDTRAPFLGFEPGGAGELVEVGVELLASLLEMDRKLDASSKRSAARVGDVDREPKIRPDRVVLPQNGTRAAEAGVDAVAAAVAGSGSWQWWRDWLNGLWAGVRPTDGATAELVGLLVVAAWRRVLTAPELAEARRFRTVDRLVGLLRSRLSSSIPVEPHRLVGLLASVPGPGAVVRFADQWLVVLRGPGPDELSVWDPITDGMSPLDGAGDGLADRWGSPGVVGEAYPLQTRGGVLVAESAESGAVDGAGGWAARLKSLTLSLPQPNGENCADLIALLLRQLGTAAAPVEDGLRGPDQIARFLDAQLFSAVNDPVELFSAVPSGHLLPAWVEGQPYRSVEDRASHAHMVAVVGLSPERGILIDPGQSDGRRIVEFTRSSGLPELLRRLLRLPVNSAGRPKLLNVVTGQVVAGRQLTTSDRSVRFLTDPAVGHARPKYNGSETEIFVRIGAPLHPGPDPRRRSREARPSDEGELISKMRELGVDLHVDTAEIAQTADGRWWRATYIPSSSPVTLIQVWDIVEVVSDPAAVLPGESGRTSERQFRIVRLLTSWLELAGRHGYTILQALQPTGHRADRVREWARRHGHRDSVVQKVRDVLLTTDDTRVEQKFQDMVLFSPERVSPNRQYFQFSLDIALGGEETAHRRLRHLIGEANIHQRTVDIQRQAYRVGDAKAREWINSLANYDLTADEIDTLLEFYEAKSLKEAIASITFSLASQRDNHLATALNPKNRLQLLGRHMLRSWVDRLTSDDSSGPSPQRYARENYANIIERIGRIRLVEQGSNEPTNNPWLDAQKSLMNLTTNRWDTSLSYRSIFTWAFTGRSPFPDGGDISPQRLYGGMLELQPGYYIGGIPMSTYEVRYVGLETHGRYTEDLTFDQADRLREAMDEISRDALRSAQRAWRRSATAGGIVAAVRQIVASRNSAATTSADDFVSPMDYQWDDLYEDGPAARGQTIGGWRTDFGGDAYGAGSSAQYEQEGYAGDDSTDYAQEVADALAAENYAAYTLALSYAVNANLSDVEIASRFPVAAADRFVPRTPAAFAALVQAVREARQHMPTPEAYLGFSGDRSGWVRVFGGDRDGIVPKLGLDVLFAGMSASHLGNDSRSNCLLFMVAGRMGLTELIAQGPTGSGVVPVHLVPPSELHRVKNLRWDGDTKFWRMPGGVDQVEELLKAEAPRGSLGYVVFMADRERGLAHGFLVGKWWGGELFALDGQVEVDVDDARADIWASAPLRMPALFLPLWSGARPPLGVDEVGGPRSQRRLHGAIGSSAAAKAERPGWWRVNPPAGGVVRGAGRTLVLGAWPGRRLPEVLERLVESSARLDLPVVAADTSATATAAAVWEGVDLAVDRYGRAGYWPVVVVTDARERYMRGLAGRGVVVVSLAPEADQSARLQAPGVAARSYPGGQIGQVLADAAAAARATSTQPHPDRVDHPVAAVLGANTHREAKELFLRYRAELTTDAMTGQLERTAQRAGEYTLAWVLPDLAELARATGAGAGEQAGPPASPFYSDVPAVAEPVGPATVFDFLIAVSEDDPNRSRRNRWENWLFRAMRDGQLGATMLGRLLRGVPDTANNRAAAEVYLMMMGLLARAGVPWAAELATNESGPLSVEQFTKLQQRLGELECDVHPADRAGLADRFSDVRAEPNADPADGERSSIPTITGQYRDLMNDLFFCGSKSHHHVKPLSTK